MNSTRPQHVDVLVAGAGLAGLSCRAGLSGARGVVTVEQDASPGGLTRVHRRGDYTFDSTVHALFFRTPAMKRAITDLVSPLQTFEKRNAIWQFEREIRYPYQYFAADLPEEVRRECLDGFVDNPRDSDDASDIASFEDWLLAQFGEGFYRHFFGPYNRKLYGVDPSRLDPRRMTWTIPADNAAAVLAGAKDPPAWIGPECVYPRGRRGIARLVDALVEMGDGDLHLRSRVVAIDPLRREVTLGDGRRFVYDRFVSSIALPVLLSLMTSLPEDVEERRSRLRSTPVSIVEVGAKRAPGRQLLPHHWTYFPDPTVPYYRLTRLEAISPDLCPVDRIALLLECHGAARVEPRSVVQSLVDLGVIRCAGDVEHFATRTIRHAYVLFLHGYEQALEHAFDFLASCGIHSIGRYGEWGYLSCEQAMISGLKAASALVSSGCSTPGIDFFGAVT